MHNSMFSISYHYYQHKICKNLTYSEPLPSDLLNLSLKNLNYITLKLMFSMFMF